MKKGIIIFTLILTMILSLAGCGRVVPTVFTFDDTEVSMAEYNFFYKQLMLQAEQSLPEDQIEEYWETEVEGKTNYEIIKEKAYDELMNLYVVAKMAEKSGFTYDSEVMQLAADIKNQMTGGNTASFYEMTGTDAVSVDRITRLYAIRERLCQQLMEDGVIDLSEEAMKKAFEEKYYKAQHILFQTVDATTGAALPEEEVAKKKAAAEDALKKAQKGADFTKMAAELSEDPGQETNPEGYVFTDGEMVPEFENAVKGLEVNGISGIVETSYGYHIIKRVPLSFEKDGASAADFQQNMSSDLITEYLNANTPEWKKDFNIVENKGVIDNLKR